MKALYVGYTAGTDNHGDEALMWIIRDILAPQIDVVTSGDDFDIALLGGGTLINQSPWLIDHFSDRLDKAGRGIVFGTGVGDLAFWGNHFNQWVPLLQRCEAVGVRGPRSLELLQQHGYNNGLLIGDPYLWLQAPVRRTAIPYRLGVNIGSTNNALWGTNDADFSEYIFETLQLLKRRGWTFSFMSVWKKDIPVLEELKDRLGHAAVGPVLDARVSSFETYSMLAGCEVFLGEKLHACAMAAVAGIPFIALEYQPKVRDFAASIGMDQWTVSTGERNAAALADLVEELRIQQAKIRPALSAAHTQRRHSILHFADRVKRRFCSAAPEVVL